MRVCPAAQRRPIQVVWRRTRWSSSGAVVTWLTTLPDSADRLFWPTAYWLFTAALICSVCPLCRCPLRPGCVAGPAEHRVRSVSALWLRLIVGVFASVLLTRMAHLPGPADEYFERRGGVASRGDPERQRPRYDASGGGSTPVADAPSPRLCIYDRLFRNQPQAQKRPPAISHPTACNHSPHPPPADHARAPSITPGRRTSSRARILEGDAADASGKMYRQEDHWDDRPLHHLVGRRPGLVCPLDTHRPRPACDQETACFATPHRTTTLPAPAPRNQPPSQHYHTELDARHPQVLRQLAGPSTPPAQRVCSAV